MTGWTQRIGSLSWSVHFDRMSDSDWAAYLEHVRAVIAHASEGDVAAVFTIAYRVEMPNAAQRKSLAELLGGVGAGRIGWHAFYSDSILARGVLTALDWLVTKPYEERVFANPLLGLRWAASMVDVDPEKVLEEMRARVPAAALPPELSVTANRAPRPTDRGSLL